MKFTKQDKADLMQRLFERWLFGGENIAEIARDSGIEYNTLVKSITKKYQQKSLSAK